MPNKQQFVTVQSKTLKRDGKPVVKTVPATTAAVLLRNGNWTKASKSRQSDTAAAA